MSTAAQITANQNNAQHATGPKTAEGKAASAQNAVKHGLTVSDERLASQNGAEIQRMAAQYQQQYPSDSPTAGHLRNLLACAALRQQKLESKALELLDTVAIDDPILARVERYRAAAERSFYRALKELQALVQNEAIPESVLNETKPMRPTMEQLRAKYPTMDRNALARMRAAL